MKFDTIPENHTYEHGKECDYCGSIIEVLTQRGQSEYKTDVYVLCQCGEYVHFILPANSMT